MIPTTTRDQFHAADLPNAARQSGFARTDSRTWTTDTPKFGTVTLTCEPALKHSFMLCLIAPDARNLPPEFDRITRMAMLVESDPAKLLEQFRTIATTLHIQP